MKTLWTDNDYEPMDRRNFEESINVNMDGERKSPEQQFALWKDRPRLAREEIPDKVFQILQRQHDVEDKDGADKREEFNEKMCFDAFAKEIRKLREQLKATQAASRFSAHSEKPIRNRKKRNE